MPAPSRYRRYSDGLTVEAMQSDADTTLDLCAWIPADKLRLEDMAGTPAMYVHTISGGPERVWLWNWVLRYENGSFDIRNNTRFTEEFVPAPDESSEAANELEPLDADHDAEMLAALSAGQGTAIATAGYWAELADSLAKIRAEAPSHLPATPRGYEEWYETHRPTVPFELTELRTQLADLSGLITKAHTLAAIYHSEAARLDDEYFAVAPD